MRADNGQAGEYLITLVKLAPSILSADFGRLREQLSEAEGAGAHLIHVDVMDGHFVPNITIGPVVVEAVRKYTSLPLDVHLMISDADKYIEAFARAGADYLTIHVEAVSDVRKTCGLIRQAGPRPGIAFNPETPVREVETFLADVDMVTVMSVNPGFGGQSFIQSSIEKVREVRRILDERGLTAALEVDGGVTRENAADVVAAGAHILVAGAAVFGGGDIAGNIHRVLAVLSGAQYSGTRVDLG